MGVNGLQMRLSALRGPRSITAMFAEKMRFRLLNGDCVANKPTAKSSVQGRRDVECGMYVSLWPHLRPSMTVHHFTIHNISKKFFEILDSVVQFIPVS